MMLLWTLMSIVILDSFIVIVHNSGTNALPLDTTATTVTKRAVDDTTVISGIEVPPPEILNFMRRFGYLEPLDPNGDAETLYHESAIIEAIKNIQKYGALKQTGTLDSDTLNLFNQPRCGVPDIEGTPYYLAATTSTTTHRGQATHAKLKRNRRFVIGARPFEKRRIRYFITNWSSKIPAEQVEQDIRRALQLWAKYSGLNFIRVNNTAADIIVGFGSGYHGDSYPFDGPGGILAHAFYPYEKDSWGGDVHFDEDENWQENSTDLANGVDFYAVAAHELGHSLGLAHSPISTSIMFPYYKGTDVNLDYDDTMAMYEIYLSKSLPNDDDIYKDNSQYFSATTASPAITTTLASSTNYEGDFETVGDYNARYGQVATTKQNANTTPSPKVVTSPTATASNICIGTFDAVSLIAGYVHIFKESFYWKLTHQYTVASGYPLSIYTKFPFLNGTQVERIDAVYERFDGAVVLFTGSKYWVSNGSSLLENSPRNLTDLLGANAIVTKVNAALLWPKNNLTYIFVGTKFYRYNDHNRTMDTGYPKSMARWRGIPNNIDAAATLANGKTYFFKNNLYWLYNNTYLHPERGYPRRATTAWLHDYCTTRTQLRNFNTTIAFI